MSDPEATVDHPFDTDTAVTADGEGAFLATVTDRWNNLLGNPLGGYLIAICLQALRQTMPLADPFVVSAFFLRPAQVGPAEVQADLVRAGRRTATGTARLLQDGKERLRICATFGDHSETAGRTALFNAAPELPPPEQSINPVEGLAVDGPTLIDRVEIRMPEQPGWLRGEPSGRPSAEMWARLTAGREPDLFTVPIMVDSLPFAILELGEPGSTTLELTIHLRQNPAPGWLACRNATRHVIDGLHEEDVEVWDSTGRLVAQARQLAMLAQYG